MEELGLLKKNVTLNEKKDGKNWKKFWTKYKKGTKQQSLVERKLQTEMPKQYIKEDSGCLKCISDPRKNVSICITGANDRNKDVEEDQRISGRWQMQVTVCEKNKETVHHLLPGYKRLVGVKYVKRHNNNLKKQYSKMGCRN